MTSFEDGNEFADFAAEVLWREGFVVTPFMSRRYQLERGESLQGVEFKLDNRFLETGRLSIEVYERSRCEADLGWTSSGVLRNDNTRFYVQGNSDMIFVFSVKTLAHFYAARGYEVTWCACHGTTSNVRGCTGTVSRFWLPLSDAYTYSIFWVDLRPPENVIAIANDDIPF